MKKRVITAAVLLPLLLMVVLALPEIFTAVLFGIMASVGAYELLMGTGKVKNPRLIGYAMVTAFLAAVPCGLPYLTLLWQPVVLVFVCLLLGEMLLSHAKLPFEKVAMTFVAGVVIPYLLTGLVRLNSLDKGRAFILLPFVIAFLSDTGAYFAGRAFGKHKLAPVISPNKTIEGVVGGVIVATAGVALYCLILQLAFDMQVTYLFVPIYGILGSAAAVFGDLCFSAIKRQAGIKDYGKLFPGHGGVLDRFDSMTLVAPLVEMLMLFIPIIRS